MELIELIRQIREEDSERAFRRLFDLQYERMYRIAYYFLQHEEWAKDVVLDVLTELWRRRKEMIVPKDFRSYSYTMVKNAALNYLEVEQRHQHESEDCGSEALSGSSPEETLEEEEMFRLYEETLAGLPVRCREVFILVKEECLSYAEVADRLGISVKTVDAQLQKAIKVLRDRLMSYRQKSAYEASKRFCFLFL